MESPIETLRLWLIGTLQRLTRPNAIKTKVPEKYAQMLKEAAEMPLLEIVKAKVYNALTLYGYLVFPFTFPVLRESSALQNSGLTSMIIVAAVQNVPLLWLAAIFCCVGSGGIITLWWRWRNSYVWLLASIIMPNMWNAVVGLTTTLLGVHNAQHWSTTSIVTTSITSLFSTIMIAAAVVYNKKLTRIKVGGSSNT